MAYINVNKFYEDMEKKFHGPPLVGTCSSDNVLLKHLLEDTPTADVVEVKHGKWMVTKTERSWNCAEYPTEYTCSECGRTEHQIEPYCNCGAKMDKED